jgi:hypothetical protein
MYPCTRSLVSLLCDCAISLLQLVVLHRVLSPIQTLMFVTEAYPTRPGERLPSCPVFRQAAAS